MCVTRGRGGGGGQGLSPVLGDLQAHSGHFQELEKGQEQLKQRLLVLQEEPEPGGIRAQELAQEPARALSALCKSGKQKQSHKQSLSNWGMQPGWEGQEAFLAL